MPTLTRTVSIPLENAGTELIEALQEFAQSRTTKTMIQRSEDSDVRCAMRVPLFKSCRVDPRALARGLRKIMRETIESGEPGDRVVIDFSKDADSRLVLTTSAAHASELDALFGHAR